MPLLNQLINPLGWISRVDQDEVKIAFECILRGEEPHPLRLIQVQGNATESNGLRLGRLRQWENRNLGPRFVQSVMKLAEDHSADSELASRLEALQYAILGTEPDRQSEVINQWIVRTLPELHKAKCYLVEVDLAIYSRPLASARLLYRKMLEPELFQAVRENEQAIQGAFGLMPNDSMGALSTLLPLLSANSPVYSGMANQQMSGSIVFTFAQTVRFPLDAWPTNLHQFMKPSSIGAVRQGVNEESLRAPVPNFETVSWWIQSWNRLFGQLADPSIQYWGRNKTFAPDLMVGRYYALFRLLVCVQEILINTSVDEFVRL